MTARVWAEIDVAAIKENLAAIRSFVGPQTDVMAVVKANAYGHGLVIVSRAAWDAGTRWFGVATVDEGASVRDALPQSQICLLSPFVLGEEEAIVANRLIPFLSHTDHALRLATECAKQRKSVEVHLELDTGMGRSGVLTAKALHTAEQIIEIPGLMLTGLGTHFPCADSDSEFTRVQTQELAAVERSLNKRGIHLKVIHAANSGGMVTTPESHLSLVRPGLLMYGIIPRSPGDVGLPAVRRVLTLKTRVALVKELPKGHSISYDRTHILERPSIVATLPVGYGDGYARDLSNRGAALIGGRSAPILGRVCMDMTVVDITDIGGIREGDEVVLIGAQGDAKVTVEEMSTVIGTTEHDVTTRLTERVPRIPVNGG